MHSSSKDTGHSPTRCPLCSWELRRRRSPHTAKPCFLRRYSSRAAQRTDWRRGHKRECAALRSCPFDSVPSAIRLVSRLIWARLDAARAAAGPRAGSPDGFEAGSDARADDDARADFWQSPGVLRYLEDHEGAWPLEKRRMFAEVAVCVKCVPPANCRRDLLLRPNDHRRGPTDHDPSAARPR